MTVSRMFRLESAGQHLGQRYLTYGISSGTSLIARFSRVESVFSMAEGPQTRWASA